MRKARAVAKASGRLGRVGAGKSLVNPRPIVVAHPDSKPSGGSRSTDNISWPVSAVLIVTINRLLHLLGFRELLYERAVGDYIKRIAWLKFHG